MISAGTTRDRPPPLVRAKEGRWLAYSALGLAILGMSGSAILVRWAGVSGSASAFYRVLIAAVVLVPWRVARGGELGDRRVVLLALLGGAFFAFDIAFYNTAVLRTSVATATLLGNSAPIFVGLGAWFVFHKRPRASFWTGLALALTGCALIVAVDAFAGGRAGAADIKGDVLALTAAVFWAAYMLTTEHVRTDMDTLTFNTVAIVGSVLTLLVVCLLLDVPLRGYSGRTWAALFGLGLISQLAAYFALVYALGHLPATSTSIGILAQVPLTALLAAAMLGEPISRAQVAGGVLVLAGIYVVNRPSGPR